ncbi:MAG: PhoH family protein [Candidatus Edwardsbacteria bacterium]|jgi:PhoH-like ATPase|nr:PhoH family protein [Candidatus Edwardsbacteria bacterium]
MKRTRTAAPAAGRQKTAGRKLFVVDTNVILYDHTCIYNFQEHDIVVPIVVLEELDKFKKGSDLINFEAREFIRELDKIAGDQLFAKGVALGKGRGRLSVEIGDPHSEVVYHAFTADKVDHRILALAEQLSQTRRDRQVIIVSKDINLRMKAKSLGIQAEDYETGKVHHVNELYTGVIELADADTDLITRLHAEPYAVPVADFPVLNGPVPHQYFVFKHNSSSALAHYNPERRTLERILKRPAYGIEPRNSEQIFALDALLRPEVQLAALSGKAGTGKTLLALAAALEQRRNFHQVYLARPVQPLANRDIGFLPGDIKSKIDPYMEPLWDNLAVIRHRFAPESKEHVKINDMIQNEKLVISALAYIRGRSLSNVYFIIDEAQNLTPLEVKTIITRAGEGTKIVFTGDVHQIDSPYLDSQSNGLTYLIDRMKGQPLFAHVNLVKGERSHLAELASDLL